MIRLLVLFLICISIVVGSIYLTIIEPTLILVTLLMTATGGFPAYLIVDGVLYDRRLKAEIRKHEQEVNRLDVGSSSQPPVASQ